MALLVPILSFRQNDDKIKGVTSLTSYFGRVHFCIENFVLNKTGKGSSFHLLSMASYGQFCEPCNIVFICK
jgi:hypothetical protein